MKLVTAGDNCVDFYLDTGIGYPGGNPVNVAVYAKRYIEDVSYIGVVGDDPNGKMLTSAMKEKGVDISHVQMIIGGETSVTKVRIVDNDRVFCGYEQGVHKNFALTADDIEYISGFDLFVSGIWGRCENMIPLIKSKGVITAFDFADKVDTPIFDEIAPSLDYGFFSWPGRLDYSEIESFMRMKHKRGCSTIILTLGKNGSIAFDGDKFYKYGIIPCDVVDTMGAGDSFIAGFLCGVLLGNDIPSSMEKGTESSTLTIQYKGAW